MGSTVVIADVPYDDGLWSLGFADPVAGVEESLGENPVVSLDLAVVSWV